MSSTTMDGASVFEEMDKELGGDEFHGSEFLSGGGRSFESRKKKKPANDSEEGDSFFSPNKLRGNVSKSSSEAHSSKDAPSAQARHVDEDAAKGEALTVDHILKMSDKELQPLDDPDFNPIEYINLLFPTEQSLVDLDSVMGRIKVHSSRLERDVRKQLHTSSRNADQIKQELSMAHKTIETLYTHIGFAKQQAEESEVMVQEICKEIRSLDHAINNIKTTIIAQERTQMLVSGVAQLKEWTKQKQFRQVGEMLGAFNFLSTYFTSYTNIPQIITLMRDVEFVKEMLSSIILDEFKYMDKPGVGSTAQLADICKVIDALGNHVKSEFRSQFSRRRIADYKSTFGLADENSKLEFMEKRYQWAKRELRYHEEHYKAVFPSVWCIDECTMEEFAIETNKNVKMILEYETPPVNILLHALKETLKFEKELIEYFSNKSVKDMEYLLDEAGIPSQSDDLDELDEENPNSLDAINKRFEHFQRQKELKKRREEKLESFKQLKVAKFKNIISQTFDPYLKIYIEQEDAFMQQKLDGLMVEETWDSQDISKSKVLSSAETLISTFKKSIKRCLSLSRNQAFMDLFKVFRKYIHKYLAILYSKLNTIQQDKQPKISDRREQTLCMIVNTAHYLSNICNQLVETFQNNIAETFKPNIAMEEEKQECNQLIWGGVKAMIQRVHTKVEPAFAAMTRLNWAAWESVGDQSEYVTQLSTSIAQTVPIYHDWLSNAIHFTFFCDSFLSEFMQQFVQNILRCKLISDIGAEQLLLDVTAIKSLLLELPTLSSLGKGGHAATPAPERYVKLVKKEVLEAETLLKTLITPKEALVRTFAELTKERSETKLLRIMELKAISKAEQFILLEQYRATLRMLSNSTMAAQQHK